MPRKVIHIYMEGDTYIYGSYPEAPARVVVVRLGGIWARGEHPG